MSITVLKCTIFIIVYSLMNLNILYYIFYLHYLVFNSYFWSLNRVTPNNIPVSIKLITSNYWVINLLTSHVYNIHTIIQYLINIIFTIQSSIDNVILIVFLQIIKFTKKLK